MYQAMHAVIVNMAECLAGALKGFGFATFMTRGHAESAIKTTNGQVLHLPVIITSVSQLN